MSSAITSSSDPAGRDQPLRIIACPKTHERALAIIAGWPKGRLLEVGAGSGAFALRASQLGFSVAACDLYPDQFRVPEIEFKTADISAGLPYASGSFDAMTCLETIEHLEDQFTFARECARVLRPGGQLLITTPNILSLASRWQYFWTGFFPLAPRPMNEFRRAPVHDHIHLLTYYELRYILRAAGLSLAAAMTDRRRRHAYVHLWAWPKIWLETRLALRREPDPDQKIANREIADHMLSSALLLGRTLMLVARKPAT
ncbi:MAG: methyltransferase domain-containing protein [Gemmatimonadota bacterium]